MVFFDLIFQIYDERAFLPKTRVSGFCAQNSTFHHALWDILHSPDRLLSFQGQERKRDPTSMEQKSDD
jgi:hypothetical protein